MKKFALLLASLFIFSACTNQPAAINKSPENPTPTTTEDPVSVDFGPISVTQEKVPDYKIFLIALDDKGLQGREIGCGDSVVGVDGHTPAGTPVGTLQEKMTAAYTELLALQEKEYGESGFTNTLAGHSLKLESVEATDDGKATVKFSGSISLGGACDNPRMEAQLFATAMQFPELSALDIFVNDQYLQDFLSLKN